jgi:hypothetical protein
MKFYIYNYKNNINTNTDYFNKIKNNKLTAIYFDLNYLGRRLYFQTHFFKDGIAHNIKNASIIADNGYKGFYLNNKRYGDQDNFTKQSWRKFVKLQAFL